MMSPLFEDKAIARAAKIKPGIEYEMKITLEAGNDFSGQANYTFEVSDTNGIFLDYNGKALGNVVVNGKPMTPDDVTKSWVNGFLTLPPALLKVGKNEVNIIFVNSYYHDGNGIHSTIDVDKKQYLYCQTEPYYANKIYPIFDQPDLKGYMTFTIIAPDDWVVVSNSAEKQASEVKSFLLEKRLHHMKQNVTLPDCFYDTSAPKGTKIHFFDRTKLISSYLFTFVAGPFNSIKYDDFDGPSVPMTIYCRGSLFEFAKQQSRDIFLFCKRGITFYEEFFQSKFQFNKYDFLFCPEFTVGAMEFPGAVTFNDNFIYREVPSSNQVTQRGMVILHELAHFWFGDFVTMKWWNDLWLNESFADFVCYVAMAFINRDFDFPTSDGWSMFGARKWRGYNEDSESTTHPIAGKVESTEVAESIFDGITYSKGAATLKQLYFLVSHEVFSNCLKSYFEKYGFKNATLTDFLQEIKIALGEKKGKEFDLDYWKQTWLETAGHTSLSVKWDPTKLGDQELVITQTPVLDNFKTLRYSKVRVAFFNKIGESLAILPADVIIKDQAENKFVFTNRSFNAILLNYGDWAFNRVVIDDKSREFLLNNISGLAKNESLTLLVILKSLNDSVKDAKLKGTDFVKGLIPAFLDKSRDQVIVFENTMNLIGEALGVYTPGAFAKDPSALVFQQLVAFAEKYPDQKDLIKNIKPNLIKFGQSFDQVNQLVAILEGKNDKLKHVEFNFNEMWSIVFKLYGIKEFDDAIRTRIRNFVSDKDNTDSKKYWKLAIDALTADDATFDNLWNQMANKDRTFSYTEMEYVFKGLNSGYRDVNQRNKKNDLFFEAAYNLLINDQKVNAVTFFNNGFPNTDSFDDLIPRTKALISRLDQKTEFFKILFSKKVVLLEHKKAAFELYK
jgi:aminopeptidase N